MTITEERAYEGLKFQSIRVPGHHGGKHSVGQTGRHGAGAVAESFHSYPQVGNRDTGNGKGF